MNPAVTLAALVYKHVNLSMALIYMVAQFIGAFLGYGVLKAVSYNSNKHFANTLEIFRINIKNSRNGKENELKHTSLVSDYTIGYIQCQHGGNVHDFAHCIKFTSLCS